MVYTVVRVYTEADRHDEPRRYAVQRSQRRHARQVFLWSAEPGFIAAHQNVRTAVDQHHSVDAVQLDQCLVGGAQRAHPGLGKAYTVNG